MRAVPFSISTLAAAWVSPTPLDAVPVAHVVDLDLDVESLFVRLGFVDADPGECAPPRSR